MTDALAERLAEWQDEHWAAWCLQEDLDGGEDGEHVAGPAKPADEGEPSPDLAEVIADLAARRHRAEEFRLAFEAGDASRCLALIHPEVRADPERLGDLIELAKKAIPAPPAPPEVPFDPHGPKPQYFTREEDSRRGITHGPSVRDRLDAAIAERASLESSLAWMQTQKMSPVATVNLLKDINTKIDGLQEQIRDSADAASAAVAKQSGQAAARIRVAQTAAAARGPAPVATSFDYLGRPSVQSQAALAEASKIMGKSSPLKPPRRRSRKRRRRGPAYRVAAIRARKAS
jgi:hypothetical protein